MTLEMRYILKAVIRLFKTAVTLFQKILDGRGEEID